MTEDSDTGESTQAPAMPASWLRIWIELTGAWSLAVAWPLFQGATSGPDAFTMMRAGPLDLILFVALTVLVAPTLLTLVLVAVGLISLRFRRWLGAALLGALFALVIWQALRDHIGPSGLELVLYLAVAGFIAWAYLHSKFAETMVALLAVATPVVIVAFLFTGPGKPLFFGDSPPSADGDGTGGPPVVVLVLDEFPLASLESRPGTIDAARFPNFARLANRSDWYANARSVGDVTIQAVPSILSGKRAKSTDVPPESGEYPANLFTLLHQDGYSIDADETATDLCPHDLCPDRGRTRARLAKIAFNGFEYGSPFPDRITAPIIRDLFPRTAELEIPMATQAERFIAASDRGPGTLDYQHLMVPHIPWMYLPDGTSYSGPFSSSLVGLPGQSDAIWSGPRALTNSDFQRFMLQVGYVDSLLGRLIRSMQADGSWKRSLVVVVADHGATFENPMRRRHLDEQNAGWILPVPLFVKQPGQTRGRTVKREVHTDQVLPTVLKSLKLPVPSDLPPPLGSPTPSSASKILSSDGGSVDVGPVRMRHLFDQAVDYRNETFTDSSFFNLTGDHGLIGARADHRPDLDPIDAEFDPSYADKTADPSSGYLPAFVKGTVPGGRNCPRLALALNGRVGLAVNSVPVEGSCLFSGVIDPSLFREGENDLRAFRIEAKGK